MSSPSEWRALLVSGDFDAKALTLPAGSVVDLRGADLQGLDLRNKSIFVWDLSGADLRGATFEENFIARCRLEGAQLNAPSQRLAAIQALWAGQLSDESSFSQAMLDGLDLSDRDLGELTLERCSLRGAKFGQARFETLNLSQSDLAGAQMSDMQGGDINLQHTKLGGTRLDGSSFSSLRLDKAQGIGSSWVGVKVEMVVARHAKLAEADFSGSAWQEGAFAGCELSGLKVQRADFGGVMGIPA